MIDTIKELFSLSPVLAWSLVSTLLALVIVIALWDKVSWMWLNFSMDWWRTSSLSKDLNKDTANSAWFKAEKALCREYKKFIRLQSQADFDEKVDYLTKAGDNGRSPTPTWIFVLTAILVFIEAMGFSYVLAGYTIPGASETTQQYGALGIAFLISIILFAFTHFAGHELYVSNKIKHARREWSEDGRKQKFTTDTIALAGKKNSSDDGQPSYTQMVNRVGTHENYMMTYVTIACVLIVAIGATYVRGQVLEKMLQQTVVNSQNQAELGLSITEDGLNMTVKGADDSALPDADKAQNQASKDKAVQDEVSIDRHGGWGTFIILAFIFIFLQLLGVLFGYKWGFAGRDSKSAYKAIGSGRYTSYADVRQRYSEVADTAQAKLENLQQKLMKRNVDIGTEGMHTKNTFLEFMKMARLEESGDRADQDSHTTRQAVKDSATSSVQEPTPKPAEVDAPLTVHQAMQQLNALQDKEDKRAYIKSLPVSMQEEVKSALALAKAEEAKKAQDQAKLAQLDAELDDLL
ncbi:MAG: hypothetical protein HOP26_03885 [Methylotenera sp.]|nr:hypothetical protein [Methylotenera sp.]NOU39800.1 hypothetical protein [Methylotenera sp.]